MSLALKPTSPALKQSTKLKHKYREILQKQEKDLHHIQLTNTVKEAIPKATSMKRFDKLKFIKINIFALQSTMLRRLKDRWQIGRNYLQTTYWRKPWCRDYIKDSQNLALEELSN